MTVPVQSQDAITTTDVRHDDNDDDMEKIGLVGLAGLLGLLGLRKKPDVVVRRTDDSNVRRTP